MRFGSLMSPHQRATTAPHYLPHPHSLCLFLSGILIKSADFDSHQLNAHKNTPSLSHTHIQLTIILFPSSTPRLNVYLSFDSTHRVCRATVARFQQQQRQCFCVCVCVHTHWQTWMGVCVSVLRAEGFVYSVESHTYTH